MSYGAFGAVGDLGLSMFWSLGQTGLRMVGTKGSFEALGQMVYMGFSTFGVLCTFTMPYCLYYAILFHTIPYYSILCHSGAGTFFRQGGLKIVRSCQRLGHVVSTSAPLFSNARF